jgi:DNA-binding phage protein
MPESVTENAFIDRLLEQTAPAAEQPSRGQNYNYPKRWYLKPDGMVVQLQGDPVNRAYYADKGYHEMRDQPGRDGAESEIEHYLKVEYPKILKVQREKAALINAIRRAGEQYRDLSLEDTFDDYSVDEIREYLKQIKEETGKDIRVILPARQAAEDARLMSGVETSESMSIEGLQAKLEAGRSQTLQGTGYDPIDQARRRSARGGSPT